jgi:N-acyl-D-amino-acid deacylase
MMTEFANRLVRVAVIVGVAALVLTSLPARAQTAAFDLLIRNGWVLDGGGNPKVRADVAVRGDEIVAVGRFPGASAKRTIDAAGKYVAPGFIDVHSHADRSLVGSDLEMRRAPNLVSQGITTIVGGPDGRSGWPLSAERESLESPGIPVNFVQMVGHGTIRAEVMKDDFRRVATDREIEQMRRLVRQGMELGAWGLGAGPEYSPGLFSDTEELIELAKVVGEYDGFYYAHQRSQSPIPLRQLPSMGTENLPVMWQGKSLTGTDGMKETIRIGRESGIRVVGTHIKAKGEDMWGQSAIDVHMIDRARSEGVQVYLDQYPYETFGGGPNDVIPDWAYAPPGTDPVDLLGVRFRPDPAEAKENLRANLADPRTRAMIIEDTRYTLAMQGGADRHVIVQAEDPSLVGKTLAAVAGANETTPLQQLIDFALAAETVMPGGVQFRPLAGSRFDVVNYMKQDYTATSTDAGVSLEARPGQHPRYFGSYPRKIGHYARDEGVISLPFAIRSSTSLPAQIIGLPDRGFIRPGQKADLVIFDYDRIIDTATVEDPDGPSRGIEAVIVNGVFTFEQGRPTGALPGKVLDRREVRGF